MVSQKKFKKKIIKLGLIQIRPTNVSHCIIVYIYAVNTAGPSIGNNWHSLCDQYVLIYVLFKGSPTVPLRFI